MMKAIEWMATGPEVRGGAERARSHGGAIGLKEQGSVLSSYGQGKVEGSKL